MKHSAFPAFQAGIALLYAAARDKLRVFPGSSAVEHSTVNRMVAGSNPARGANPFFISQTATAEFALVRLGPRRARDLLAPASANLARGIVLP